MRLAYADPPYPGCAHLYPEKTEVDHIELLARLGTYDGWALSTNENALRYVLALCPAKVRILAWCKTNAPPFFSHPFPSWEPVLCMPARRDLPVVRIASHLSTAKPGGFIDTNPAAFPGVKPDEFCGWILRCLGANRDDTLDDLFPGTGSMTRAWEAFRAQTVLFDPPTGGSRSHRERIRSSQLGESGLLEEVG